MPISKTFLLTVLIVVLSKTLAWLIQLRTRNAGLVDTIWAWTLGALAGVYALFGSAPAPLRGLLALMGVAWGLRLGTHLLIRNHGKPEDWRYAQFRARWGARADFNMFWFFQFQNVFTLLLSSSAFLAVAYRPDMPPGWCCALALGAPWGWTSLLAPLVMSWLLLKLSGVPMLEAGMGRRKPGYADYMRSTNALIPWPPRRG